MTSLPSDLLFQGISPSVVERFISYHKENPQVFDAFKLAAVRLKDAGIKHFGAKAILEKLRYESAVRAGTDQFKINNSMASCYARLLMWEMPEFTGFFELRSTPERAA